MKKVTDQGCWRLVCGCQICQTYWGEDGKWNADRIDREYEIIFQHPDCKLTPEAHKPQVNSLFPSFKGASEFKCIENTRSSLYS